MDTGVQCDLYEEQTPSTYKGAGYEELAHPDVVVELVESTLGESGKQGSDGAARVRYESFSDQSSVHMKGQKQQETSKALKPVGEHIESESDITTEINEQQRRQAAPNAETSSLEASQREAGPVGHAQLEPATKLPSKSLRTEGKLGGVEEEDEEAYKERGLKAVKGSAKRVSFKTEKTVSTDHHLQLLPDEPEKNSVVVTSVTETGKTDRSPQRPDSGKFNITRNSRVG